MLDYAQRWTAAVDWRSVEETQRELERCNAFMDANVADKEGKRLRMAEHMTTLFERYIGIDYSGAKTPTASLTGLRVYCGEDRGKGSRGLGELDSNQH